MKTKIFIDGKEGTTGLKIFDRLTEREDIFLITLSDELRKNVSARTDALNSCDIAFLCLPDAAAAEAAELVTNPDVRIIDASTAHRTAEGWTYGLPELFSDGFEKVMRSKRIAVPGCHASGFIALVAPLIRCGLIDTDALLCCTSITGYSGGGKKMIAEYTSPDRSALLAFPRHYALAQQHKHLKEMKAICSLSHEPAFYPIVCDFYSGMCSTVTLFASGLHGSMQDVKNVYSSAYSGDIVYYNDNADESGFLSAGALCGLDSMEISVQGCEDRVTLCARYDNLGKGASGAAIECMNILIGAEPGTGLKLK